MINVGVSTLTTMGLFYVVEGKAPLAAPLGIGFSAFHCGGKS